MNATVTSATTVREVATAYATSTVTEKETLTETKTEVQASQEFNIFGLRTGEIALAVSFINMLGLVLLARSNQRREQPKLKNTGRKAKKPSTPPTSPPSAPVDEKKLELGGLPKFADLISMWEKRYGSQPTPTA